MAAQVDLHRAKVEEEKVRYSLDRLIKEKKKKKKRDLSPPAVKRERFEKDEKKVQLHHHNNNNNHHQHVEHRSQQPHQLQQNPKAHNISAEKHVLHSHHHHNHSLSNGTKKNLRPTLPPPSPRKVPEQLQKKRAVPPEPPALFTFTPLKVVKAKPQDFQEKHREKELKLKKENTEANVKHAELKLKKGEFNDHVHVKKRVSC